MIQRVQLNFCHRLKKGIEIKKIFFTKTLEDIFLNLIFTQILKEKDCFSNLG